MQDDDQAPPIAQRAERPLDYAPPLERSRRGMLWLGIGASLFFAIGFAMIAGGLMMSAGDRDRPPTVAMGVGCVVFGGGVITSAWLSRR